MASHQTSSTPWSDSLSCSVKPTRCFAPETWDLSSATSSSQTWTTWRPSGATTWMEICWRPSSWSSSMTAWGWQQGQRVYACWSVWTRMTMRKAEGCYGLLAVREECCNLVPETTDRLAGLYKQIPSGMIYKPWRMKWLKKRKKKLFQKWLQPHWKHFSGLLYRCNPCKEPLDGSTFHLCSLLTGLKISAFFFCWNVTIIITMDQCVFPRIHAQLLHCRTRG